VVEGRAVLYFKPPASLPSGAAGGQKKKRSSNPDGLVKKAMQRSLFSGCMPSDETGKVLQPLMVPAGLKAHYGSWMSTAFDAALSFMGIPVNAKNLERCQQ
jgi:hypothetical protein